MWSQRPKNVESNVAFILPEIRKIIKIVATVCQILRLKCTGIQFRLGLCPRPPPDLLEVWRTWMILQTSWLRGPSSKGRGMLWSHENRCNRR